MTRQEIQREVREQLEALGVPSHLASVTCVPSTTKVSVLCNGLKRELAFKSGMNRQEFEFELGKLIGFWKTRQSQRDLEDAIKEAV